MVSEKSNLLSYISNECCSLTPSIMSLILTRGAEFEIKDMKKIERHLDKFPDSKGSAVIIISGEGGDTVAGMRLAVLIRKKFKGGIITLVPDLAGSCLVYPVLISSSLLLGENAYLTPIDPIFRSIGGLFSATSNLNHNNPRIRRRARKFLEDTIGFCLRAMDERGSIIFDPNRINVNHLKSIVELFFKSPHTLPISYDMLKKLKFKVFNYTSDEVIANLIDKYLSIVTLELQKNGKKGVFEFSNKTLWL